MTNHKFNIGDRVVPHDKTSAHGDRSFSRCNQWELGKKQGFLYVVDKEYGDYVLNSKSDRGTGGNYYREEDITPYAENEEELFELFVRGQLTQEQYERRLCDAERG